MRQSFVVGCCTHGSCRMLNTANGQTSRGSGDYLTDRWIYAHKVFAGPVYGRGQIYAQRDIDYIESQNQDRWLGGSPPFRLQSHIQLVQCAQILLSPSFLGFPKSIRDGRCWHGATMELSGKIDSCMLPKVSDSSGQQSHRVGSIAGWRARLNFPIRLATSIEREPFEKFPVAV